LIITDGIEMRAVADRYGLAGASVRAIAAGADAICVGGGHAVEETVESLSAALVEAVRTGELPEERLVEAARRVEELADWTLAAEPALDVRQPAGMIAARRAVRLFVRPEGEAVLPVRGEPHVVEFAATTHLAIEASTPWGVAGPLRVLLPDTTSVRLHLSDLDDLDHVAKVALEPAAGRTLVLVIRDAHRHPPIARAVAHLLELRPDAVVVDLGLPGPEPLGTVYLATHGAALACGQAAAELLAGH
jgi:beta-N-acetylhexosaminidase